MGRLIKEIEVENVGELRAFLSELPDNMQVNDSVGELLCLRIYQCGAEQVLEVA